MVLHSEQPEGIKLNQRPVSLGNLQDVMFHFVGTSRKGQPGECRLMFQEFHPQKLIFGRVALVSGEVGKRVQKANAIDIIAGFVDHMVHVLEEVGVLYQLRHYWARIVQNQLLQGGDPILQDEFPGGFRDQFGDFEARRKIIASPVSFWTENIITENPIQFG